MTTPNRDQALARYPVLRDLVDVTGSAWRWMAIASTIHGVRAWAGGTVDTILIRGETDAAALRTAPDDEEVWKVDGTVADVVDGLYHLPAPGAPGAPRLALARPPRLVRPPMP